MDAIRLLKQHHRSAEAALKKLCRAYDRSVLDQLANELGAHMVIEETIFYPAVEAVEPELVLGTAGRAVMGVRGSDGGGARTASAGHR